MSSTPSLQQWVNAWREGTHRLSRKAWAGGACSPANSPSSACFPRTSRGALHFLRSEKSVANPHLAPSAVPPKQASGNSSEAGSRAALAHHCSLPSFCQGRVGRRCQEASSDGVRRPLALWSAGGARTPGASRYDRRLSPKIQKSHIKAACPLSCPAVQEQSSLPAKCLRGGACK